MDASCTVRYLLYRTLYTDYAFDAEKATLLYARDPSGLHALHWTLLNIFDFPPLLFLLHLIQARFSSTNQSFKMRAKWRKKRVRRLKRKRRKMRARS
ncbi:hypothetical protein E4U43_000638 [Claviceps pusilla]|uniref:60S ribosomal protein L41 n=1 Tax=Claviceps pusilla TaxID=123648 RepID=A0A9P7NAC8_9HYPO|nr:hypothetical protein E4U43_000638 [Claviceps pusilla]